MTHSLSSLLQDAYYDLSGHTDTPQLDAQVLFAHILDKPRAWVLSHPDAELLLEDISRIQAAIKRMVGGEPLPYILDSREFYALRFKINKNVLIPRPETELIVDQSLVWIATQNREIRAVDIGTGSGCIAITIAAHARNITFDAYDINTGALDIARFNAEAHGVNERITFYEHDISEGFIHSSYDLIVTNPPYISTDTLQDLDVYGREPTSALDGGEDGLDVIRRILHHSPGVLNPGGLVLCEIESRQGAMASRLAETYFPDAEISIIKDLASLDRVLRINLRKPDSTGSK